MEVIIRADTDKSIGIGHLIRAKNLYNFFIQKKIKVQLILKGRQERINQILKKKNNYKNIYKFKSFNKEKYYLLKFFKKKPKILIIDLINYQIYKEFVKTIRELGHKVILICDHNKKINFPSDMIINSNPLQCKIEYKLKKQILLFGPKYMIMDKAYKNIKKPKFKKKINNIMITLGGTDQKNIIFSLVEIIENNIQGVNINIFTTTSTKYIKELNKLKKLENIKNKYNIHINKKNLSPYWNENDIAITAGGNSLYERIASGIPGISLSQFNQQFHTSEEFERLGLNYNLGKTHVHKVSNFENRFLEFINKEEIRRQQYDKISKFKINNASDLIYDQIKIMMDNK